MSVNQTVLGRPWSNRRLTRSGGNDAAGSTTVVFTCPATCRFGDLISVRVSGQFRFFTPIISSLLGTPTVDQTAQVVIQ